jgi:transcription initiation factor TFIIE subunit alpha
MKKKIKKTGKRATNYSRRKQSYRNVVARSIKQKKAKKAKVVVKEKKIKHRGLGKEDKERVKLLQEIVISVAGINSANIVNLLYKNNNVNEFDIAKKLGITINQARNILYKLAEEGLVSFTRKKDKKSGGWYTYFWSLNVEKSLILLQRKIDSKIKSMEFQATSKQSKRFYYCAGCGIEMSEENALLYNFTCPECGEVFQLKNNKELIEKLGEEIKELKHISVLVKRELVEIDKKNEIAKLRRLRAEEKSKKKEREARKKERLRLKEEEGRKLKRSKTTTFRKGSRSPKGHKKKVKKAVKKKSRKAKNFVRGTRKLSSPARRVAKKARKVNRSARRVAKKKIRKRTVRRKMVRTSQKGKSKKKAKGRRR